MFCFQAMEAHISRINFLMRFPAFLVIATSCFELSVRQCFHLLYFALFSYIFNAFFSFLAVCPIHLFFNKSGTSSQLLSMMFFKTN